MMHLAKLFNPKLKTALVVLCLVLVRGGGSTQQATVYTESCSYTIMVNRKNATVCPVVLPNEHHLYASDRKYSHQDTLVDDDRDGNEAKIHTDRGDYYFDRGVKSPVVPADIGRRDDSCRRRVASLIYRLEYLQQIQRMERRRAENYESSVKGHNSQLNTIDFGLSLLKTNLSQLVRAMHSMETKVYRQERISTNLQHKLSSVVLDMEEVSKNYGVQPRKSTSDLTDSTKGIEKPQHTKECSHITPGRHTFPDCSAVRKAGFRKSGKYTIQPSALSCSLSVWCDMETDRGGWLLLQRRSDGTENFNRNWTDYKVGFGDIGNEFWLGNDNIFLISNQAVYELRIDLWDYRSNHAYAKYKNFKVEGERDRYRIHVSTYSGTARNSLYLHNYASFSTMDRDNDKHPRANCASQWDGGWWFTNCWRAMLNGLYHQKSTSRYRGIAWNSWKHEQLKRTEMKIRPIRH